MTQTGSGIAPVLSSSASSLVLTEATKAAKAITLNWTAADYGYQAAVKYTVQFAAKGTNFPAATTKEVAISANTFTLSYTVEQLNSLLLVSGFPYGKSSDVEMRVKAVINSNVAPIYSNVATLSVTPYEIIIVYPTWYVPGAHQADPTVNGVKVKGYYSNPDWDGGWNPATAPTIMSLKDDGIYKGFVNFPSAVNPFKVVPVKKWEGQKGGFWTSTDAGGVNYGTIANVEDNIEVKGAGFYLLEVDLNTNTFKASPRNYAVIGSATPDPTWGSDFDLTYDPVSGTLKRTIQLTAGELKFRVNDDWSNGLDLGDGDADGVLDRLSNNNIKVTVPGTYVIEIDFRNYGKWKYSLTKQ